MAYIDALIPAKGRSTRLPGKNSKPLAGIPMVARVIRTLQSTQLFDRIWVSTEDGQIADLAEREGGRVLYRPQELSADRATVNQVCLQWLENLEQKPEQFCCVYPTSVFLTEQDLIDANKLLTPDCDGVMGVSRYNYPPVQALEVTDDGVLTSLMPRFQGVQSQFYPTCCVSNGSQYWLNTASFLEQQTFYVRRLKPYFTDESHILDINTLEDFKLAEDRAQALGWYD